MKRKVRLLAGTPVLAAFMVLATNAAWAGPVVAWGENAHRQTNVPAGFMDAAAVSARQNHTSALRAAQALWRQYGGYAGPSPAAEGWHRTVVNAVEPFTWTNLANRVAKARARKCQSKAPVPKVKLDRCACAVFHSSDVLFCRRRSCWLESPRHESKNSQVISLRSTCMLYE
jgi:hypothetical protein